MCFGPNHSFAVTFERELVEAGKRNITDIFNRMRLLIIPFFQRSYVWDEENWERLLADFQAVAATKRPYFLGSVILKQQPTGSGVNTGDTRIVIDGQQRLTTLLLFFKVLYQARKKDDFGTTFFDLQGRLMLQHNRNDIEIFEAILTDKLNPKLEKEYSKNQVFGAYQYFLKKKEIAEIDPLDIFRNIYFVGIDLGADEDEQQVFDTINSLGVSLSTAELLKNDLFNRQNAALYDSTWQKAFEESEEDRQYWATPITAGRERRENVDLFMQSFLLTQVKSPDQVRVDALFRSFKDHLGGITDKGQFIAELTDTATVYRNNIDPQVQEKNLSKADCVDRLMAVVFGLNTTTVVPYILYVLRKATPVEVNRICSLLEGYLLRRVICRQTSKNYNRLFGSFIGDQVYTAEQLVARFKAEADTVNCYPSDTELHQSFHNENLTNKQALVVLWLLELSVRNDKKQSTALAGLSHYSLEHLMPKKWRNHWNRLPVEKESQRDQILKKLGNLSLLASGLNTSISDADWSTKKVGSGEHKGLLEYAQGLETLSADLKLDVWDEDKINERGARLAKQAGIAWPAPF